MKVFVTGASGFIGQVVVKELLAHGYEVVGMTRSQSGVDLLSQMGAEPYLSTLQDLQGLALNAQRCDAVIHTAFNHDFSTFVQNCQDDKQVVKTLGDALNGSEKPLIVTSGAFYTGLETNAPTGCKPLSSKVLPRVASDEAAHECATKGVKTIVVGLPQVHDTTKFGLVSNLFELAANSDFVGYVGEGDNLWSAAHRLDIAAVYRLALEKGRSGEKYLAVAEEALSFKSIAQAVAARLNLPLQSLDSEEANAYFGPFARLAQETLNASGDYARETLGWNPSGPTLFDDIVDAVVTLKS